MGSRWKLKIGRRSTTIRSSLQIWKVPELEAFMDELRRAGDSAGSEIYVEVQGVPPGVGERFIEVDACLAYALWD